MKGQNPHGQTLDETFFFDISWADREHQCLVKLSDWSPDLQPINPQMKDKLHKHWEAAQRPVESVSHFQPLSWNLITVGDRGSQVKRMEGRGGGVNLHSRF